GARRLRPRAGARTPGGVVRRANRAEGRLPLRDRRGPAPERGRDRAVPRRAGVAHERGQAFAREPRQHRPHAQGRRRRGRRRGRRGRIRSCRFRRRHRAARHARTSSAARRNARRRVVGWTRDDARGRGSVAMTTRILIVDDHAVVRKGLRLVLDGEAGNGRDAIFQARALKPDVILLDVVMPERSGLDVLPQLIHEHPDVKVLVLSMQDDPQYVRQAFASGASGYVLKEAADTEVVNAIRDVAAGGRYVHPELGARLIAADAEAARRAAADPLSEREHEVLRLLALGHTNQEIAKMLFISVRTTETHRAHIMQKLGLQSRAELVQYALANGLIDQM